jgi:hypothetical protein
MVVKLTLLFDLSLANNVLDEISFASDLKVSRATLRIGALKNVPWEWLSMSVLHLIHFMLTRTFHRAAESITD